jgi:uncharacterized protein
MSVANPKSQEPSMEEILASIRRIIADDQEVAKAPPAPKPAPAPAPPPRPAPAAVAAPPPLEEDVLELAEVAQPVKLATRPAFEEEPPEIDFREIEEAPPAPEPIEPIEPSAPPPMREMREAPVRALDQDALLSETTHAAVGQAFNMLAHTVLTSNARTLEDLVREMLRPMLKNWLDDNLPSVVERLVRAEIERVARGGR